MFHFLRDFLFRVLNKGKHLQYIGINFIEMYQGYMKKGYRQSMDKKWGLIEIHTKWQIIQFSSNLIINILLIENC